MALENPTAERKSLLHSTDDAYIDVYEPEDLNAKPHRKDRSTLFYVVVAVLCTCLNVYAYKVAHKPRVERFYDYARLRRPNPWVGLDRVSLPEDVHSTLIYPNQISQINAAEPGRAYSDDPIRIAAVGGLTAPEDREFKVTPKVSTLVEFRTVDYKMENCELALSLPSTTTSNFSLGMDDNLVDIWSNSADSPINPKKLTWDTRPARVVKIDTVVMRPGTNYTYRFPCPTDSLFTFEFSASNDSTHVAWTQNHVGTSGVVLWQHATFLA